MLATLNSSVFNGGLSSKAMLQAASLCAGVLSHVFFFVHSELDHLAAPIVGLALVIPGALFASLLWRSYSVLQAFYTASAICSAYALGLTVSIIVYRIYFHPLRQFPGPFWAKITKWWGAYQCLSSGMHYNRIVYNLHQKYGPIVRTGPNELSINEANCIPDLAKFAKNSMYDLGLPHRSVHSLREIEPHRLRRKVWDRAFTAQAVNDYIPTIHTQSDNLITELASTQKGIKLSDYFNYYTFDVMGALTFGWSFNLLKTKGKGAIGHTTDGLGGGDYFMRLTHKSQEIVTTFLHIPWFPRILNYIPGATKEFDDFLAWCLEVVNRRKADEQTRANEGLRKDIYSWLLEAEDTNTGPHKTPLEGEARLAIIAGSDTTSTALMSVFAHLAACPEQYIKLQKEIDELYENTDAVDKEGFPGALRYGSDARTRHLDGVIREALRLNPPLSNALGRSVPEGGYTFTIPDESRKAKGEVFHLPALTKVYVPLYTSMRSEKNYVRAEDFIPERWYAENQATMVKNKHAYIPFWTGMFSCVGKSVALLQLRIMTAKIVRNFDFKFPGVGRYASDPVMDFEEERKDEVRRKETLRGVLAAAKDTFTVCMGDLDMEFRERVVKRQVL